MEKVSLMNCCFEAGPAQNCNAVNDFAPSKSAETLISRQCSASSITLSYSRHVSSAGSTAPALGIIDRSTPPAQRVEASLPM